MIKVKINRMNLILFNLLFKNIMIFINEQA